MTDIALDKRAKFAAQADYEHRIRSALSQPHPADERVVEVLDDTKRFDKLRDESWDLRCFDIPTGGDDYDIGWRVVGHWMAEPRERTIAEVYHDDPRAAIDEAISSLSKSEGRS
jgi:hypothetical protein